MDFFRSVLNGMMDMVRVVDDRHNVVLTNTTMDNMFGDTVGKPCYRVHSGQPCANCISCMAMYKGETFQKEVELQGKIYSVVASPLGGPGEECHLGIEVWRDITELYNANKTIEAQNAALKRELRYARRLQYSILPKHLPQVEGYSFDAEYRPCEELSGDFYDLFPVDEDHIAFCIADVSGHGVTAAMLTVFFGRLLRYEMQPGVSPAQALQNITRRFSEMEFEEQLYITAVLGVLECSTGRVIWCNAGHSVPPEVFAKDHDRTLYMPGMPICRWMQDVPRRDEEFYLPHGAKLFLYTDGLECLWKEGAEPEEIHYTLQEILNTTQRGLREFWQHSAGRCDTPADDAAMLLLHRKERT